MKTYIIEASFMKRIEGAYREEVEPLIVRDTILTEAVQYWFSTNMKYVADETEIMEALDTDTGRLLFNLITNDNYTIASNKQVLQWKRNETELYETEVELRVLVRYELTGNVLREELGGNTSPKETEKGAATKENKIRTSLIEYITSLKKRIKASERALDTHLDNLSYDLAHSSTLFIEANETFIEELEALLKEN